MLDYLISLLDFEVSGTTYNLFKTPWDYMIQWIGRYNGSTSQVSTAVRDAYFDLMKFAFWESCLVVILIVICVFFVYKIASGFTGWFKFR